MKGYRINWPEEIIAWKALQFEYEELGNEHILGDLQNFLHVQGDWPRVFSIFRARYGDVTGLWLTRSRDAAMEYYGEYGGGLLIYEYEPRLIISDIGHDGFFVLNAKFIRED